MDLLYGQKKTFSGGTKVGNLKPVWEVNQNVRFASSCPIVDSWPYNEWNALLNLDSNLLGHSKNTQEKNMY